VAGLLIAAFCMAFGVGRLTREDPDLGADKRTEPVTIKVRPRTGSSPRLADAGRLPGLRVRQPSSTGDVGANSPPPAAEESSASGAGSPQGQGQGQSGASSGSDPVLPPPPPAQ
jgi:hypothetical protein